MRLKRFKIDFLPDEVRLNFTLSLITITTTITMSTIITITAISYKYYFV